MTSLGEDTISVSTLALMMMMFSLPQRHESLQSILSLVENLNLEQAELQIILAEENWLIRNKGSPALLLGGKCPHKRTFTECWTCTPAKHPKNATCNDCGKKGHFSRKWKQCELNSIPRNPKTPSSDDFKEKLVGLASNASLWTEIYEADLSRPYKRSKGDDLRTLININKGPINPFLF